LRARRNKSHACPCRAMIAADPQTEPKWSLFTGV